MNKRLRKAMLYFFLALAAFGIITFVSFAFQVDDWSRDLNVKYAELSADAQDEQLRIIEVDSSAEKIADAITAWAERESMWQAIANETEGSTRKLHLTRTTKLFRFVDDIHVTIDASETGCRIWASSESRIGKGDLGQNPRNLKELASAIRSVNETQ